MGFQKNKLIASGIHFSPTFFFSLVVVTVVLTANTLSISSVARLEKKKVVVLLLENVIRYTANRQGCLLVSLEHRSFFLPRKRKEREQK
jgi:hypothetical protein